VVDAAGVGTLDEVDRDDRTSSPLCFAHASVGCSLGSVDAFVDAGFVN
jgi:hypothetical protein